LTKVDGNDHITTTISLHIDFFNDFEAGRA
jgi:hypothetical protein